MSAMTEQGHTGTEATVPRRKFVIEMDLSGAAFGQNGQGDSWETGTEVARLLREVADHMYGGNMYGGDRPHRASLVDLNGNVVGYAEFRTE